VFHELARNEVMQMVDLMTKRLTGQLETGTRHRAHAERQGAARREGLRPQLGPPAASCIQRMIEDVLSEKILYKEFHAGEIIVVDTEDDPDRVGEKKLSFRGVEGFQPPATVALATTAADTVEPPAPAE